MKKTYNAPELYYEEYELCTSIAGNCGNKLFQDKITSNSYLDCTVEMGRPGQVLFVEDNTLGCTVTPTEEDGYLCYQSFSTNDMIFNS